VKPWHVLLGLMWCFASLAQEVMPPAPTHYFNDYAHVVSATNATRLDAILENHERQSSDQIVVAIFPKMQSDSPIKDYTLRIANSWKVGQKNKNNAVVLFLFISDRKMYMQVGTGLEKALPNDKCQEIIDGMVPYFKKGDFDGGLNEGVTAIIKAAQGAHQGNNGRSTLESQNSNTNAAIHGPP
jgi:uncharacterized protein